MSGPSTPSLDALSRHVTGTLHTPGSPQWDLARMPWLVNVEQHPLAVLEVADADDVVHAVKWAGDHGVKIAAQAKGHGAGHQLDSTLLIRTRALNDISVDVSARIATVGAGVSSGELSAALAGTGLAFLVGSNPDPSVVGLTLAGGLSWFGRAFGLACDSIIRAQIVDGSGVIRTVSVDQDSDVLWALRGGGGDFGVVLSIDIALHPVAQIHGGRLLWPVDQMAEVMRAFREVCKDSPEEFSIWYHTLNFPPFFPEVPEPFRGKAFCVIALAHLGESDELEGIIAPLRAVPGVVADLVGPIGVELMADLADEPTEPMPGMLRSTLLSDLDDDTIDKLVELMGPQAQSPLMMLQIRQLGGALQRTPAVASAHGVVDAPFNIQALGVPAVPELVPVIAASLQAVLDAVAPLSTGQTLMNFLDHDQSNDWWDEDTRSRLQQVKQQVDPRGIFVSNRPVHR